MLLVDTPETNHPTLPVQKYGPEATEFAEEKLAGEEVELEYDGPKRDKYDSLLAYIWVDGQLFNEMLLEEGLARYAMISYILRIPCVPRLMCNTYYREVAYIPYILAK